MKSHWQIAIALSLAVVVGALAPVDSDVIAVCGFVGGLFLNALKMVVVPLIVSSIINAMSTFGDAGALSRIGIRTMLFYSATTLLAVLVGLTMVNLVQPGVVDGQPARELLGLAAGGEKVSENVSGAKLSDIADVFYRLVTANPIKAAAESDLLGLVFFSMLFGIFAARIPGSAGQVQRDFWSGVRETMMHITALVMRFAPIGVFALVAKAFSSTGVEAIRPLAMFFFATLGGLLFHMLVTMSVLLAVVGRVSPLRMLQAMTPALLTGFSTSSSAGTLPVTLDCLRNRAGVSERVTGFTLPLGAAINLDGTALYECAAAMFLAQAYGLHLDFATQFVIVAMAVVTSMGVTGIPSASLVAIAVILGAVGLPLEGLGVLLAVDRVLDMCRTAVNVYGDGCGAVVIGRLEGESGILKQPD
ncbi:dicarboxylate/amino acid:cation symporter [Nevskia sp.]|uniref:dicarboxylate/amino acid:cation symporter n=1 Tax=Nevskia sp. TaxID=1929292 RepID=UPI0025CC6A34|nr:dicarboxylate/amino acid:cation symporter [Nevskia sp.]